ncbi:MAG: matrixin family metalloprotease [Deltaproteobacteria bacterium]|nr:matrixin family metalloprotease [Deltaproteobacteria bacterium]
MKILTAFLATSFFLFNNVWAQTTDLLDCNANGPTYNPSGYRWAIVPNTASSPKPIEYRICSKGSDDISPFSSVENSIVDAIDEWNEIECENGMNPNISFAQGDDYPTADNGGDDNNIIYWIENNWVGDSQAVAITASKYYTDTGYEFTSDMAFNGVNFSFRAGGATKSCSATGSNADSCFDIFDVALHEMGHFLGLNHVACPDSVMYPQGDPTSINSEISEHEIAGICALYPPRMVETASKRDFGEACTINTSTSTSNCADGSICVTSALGPGWCSNKCGSNDDCPRGFYCAQLEYNGKAVGLFCKPGVRINEPTMPIGEDLLTTCQDIDECSTEICAWEHDYANVGFCTWPCSKDAGYDRNYLCPIGMDCIAGYDSDTNTRIDFCWPRTGFDPASAFVTKGLNSDCYDASAGAGAKCGLSNGRELTCFQFGSGSQGIIGSCVEFCNDTAYPCIAGYTCCYGLDSAGQCVTEPPSGSHNSGCFKLGNEGDPAILPNESLCLPGHIPIAFGGDYKNAKCYRTCEAQQCANGQTCLQFSAVPDHNICCNNGTGYANQPVCQPGPPTNDRSSGSGGCSTMSAIGLSAGIFGLLIAVGLTRLSRKRKLS